MKTSITANSFAAILASLYLSDKVTGISGKEAAEDLPPMEALVLGLMCMDKKYNSQTFLKYFSRTHKQFDNRECGIIVEQGILNLVAAGYLKPANSKAKIALEERDDMVWGLGDIPFIVTAKGAKRICYLVGSVRGEPAKQVCADIQAESKAASKSWTPSVV